MDYKTKYFFYQTYIDLIDNYFFTKSNIVEDNTNSEINSEFNLMLKDTNFRNYFLDKLGKSIDSIKILVPAITPNMLRPQRLYMDFEKFYIACDMISNTYYICYKNLLMIDIDYYKNNLNQQLIIDNFNKSEDTWMLYKSRNGVHGFLVSRSIEYNSDEAINIMLSYNCDFYYIIYSYIRGFCVRLNRKKNEEKISYIPLINNNEDNLYGNKLKINPELQKLVNIHIKMIEIFKKDGYSLMKGD